MSLDSATEYALSFSPNAVHLRQRERIAPRAQGRAAAIWRHLGSVDFDSAAFRDDIDQLRRLATGLGNEAALPVTLVIPDDQVLYTTLTIAPGSDRDQAVGRALDGLTPYRIEDLAFDWDGEGDVVRVAAVARQTLQEARDFAAQYAFDVLSYCSDPGRENFPFEPKFDLSDQQQAPRAAVDPSQAGVTAAALMFGDDAAEVAPEMAPELAADASAEADAAIEDAALDDLDDQAAAPAAGLFDLDLDADSGLAADMPAQAAPDLASSDLQSGDAQSGEPVDRPEPPADPVDEPLPPADPADDPDAPVIPAPIAPPPADVPSDLPDTPPPISAQVAPAPISAQVAAAPITPRLICAHVYPVLATPAPDADVTAGPASNAPLARPAKRSLAEVMSAHVARPNAPKRPQPLPQVAEIAMATADAPAEAADDAPHDARGAPPVVRHAPARSDHQSAPRPETRAEPRIHALNPRARAVHERAAQARAERGTAAPAEAIPAPPRAGYRGNMSNLVSLIAALVIGLVLAWAFLMPGDQPGQPGQIASAPASDRAATSEAAGARDAQPPAATVPTVPMTAPEAATATAPTQSAVSTPAPSAPISTPTPTPTPTPQAAREAAASARPGDVMPSSPQASALTDAEARRLVIAAAAVGAAIVPPSAAGTVASTAAAPSAPPTAARSAATTPAPSQPRPAATTAPIAAAPTASAAPAPARVATPRPAPVQSTAPRAAATATRNAPAKAAPKAATKAPVVAQGTKLTSSARPQLPPRRATPQTSVPRADSAPRVPTSPLPYEAAQRSVQPASSSRPPARSRAGNAPAATQAATTPAPATQAPAAAPRAVPAAAPNAQASSAAPIRGTMGGSTAGGSTAGGSSRPPGRPEGSAPDLIEDEGQGAALMPAEQSQLDGLIRDMARHGVTASQASLAQLPAAAAGPRYADTRPARRPRGGSGTATDAPSPSAIDRALRSASTAPPDRPAGPVAATAAPARNSGGLLRGSLRPSQRPSGAAPSSAPSSTPSSAASASGLSKNAVESAIAAAVDSSPATPGSVGLSSLASSPMPPRRSGGAATASAAAPASAPQVAPATAPASASAPTPDAAPDAAAMALAAAPSGPNASELAARRALDEQLQSQAEARIRARAASDAAAEASARAQAEARARAQAAAEERTARARKQDYKPPEIDDEPEIAAAVGSGATTASVAKSATQARGIDLGRTTIIGIIGAGQASRALIRLRNGKIVTVRIGDRIDGGTINSIGEGRLTYVKSGQTRELRMLDGR